MACGVPATGNSLRVALFTPTSVAWADNSTAASSSKTVVYSSSVLGWGLAAFSAAKKGSICAVFMVVWGVVVDAVRPCIVPQRTVRMKHARPLATMGSFANTP